MFAKVIIYFGSKFAVKLKLYLLPSIFKYLQKNTL